MDIKLLIKEAINNLNNAYAPYSKFYVSAILYTKSGKIYKGVNIENASYPAGICAERSAISEAISHGDKDFEMIVIVGGKDGKVENYCPPCGICRQSLSEFVDDNFKIVLAKSEDDYKIYHIDDLLPESFSKNDL